MTRRGSGLKGPVWHVHGDDGRWEASFRSSYRAVLYLSLFPPNRTVRYRGRIVWHLGENVANTEAANRIADIIEARCSPALDVKKPAGQTEGRP